MTSTENERTENKIIFDQRGKDNSDNADKSELSDGEKWQVASIVVFILAVLLGAALFGGWIVYLILNLAG